jgi:hypothetical protein
MEYEYKTKRYYKSGEAEMKNPHTRKWEKCVIYVSVENDIVYIRNKEEFDLKFKLVENE